jgi:hypothetical protein
MKVSRKIARIIIPFPIRNKLRKLVFNDLRRLGILHSFRKIGFLTCKNYIEINSNNAKEILNKYSKFIKIHTMVEEDEIKSVKYLKGQDVEGIQPFIAKTETLVLDIADNKFSLRNNHLLDHELNIIGEARTEELNKLLPVPIYQQVISKATQLKGTVAYLSDPDPANYYHWMCRTLPLLNIYQNLFDLQEIDFFYLGQFPLSSFHKESLAQAGVAMNKVTQESCIADRLLVAITNRTIDFGDAINKKAYLFTRNLFLEKKTLDFHKKNNKRRIYVKRGNTSRRKISNEMEVIHQLEKYGFEAVVMDNKTVQEQAQVFYQAEAIIAAHGAALTNLLFIQPGVKVIELIPYGYVNNCFYVMASHGKADYFYLQGERTNQSNIDIRNFDIYIDLQKLDSICKMASLDKVETV